MHWMPDQSLMTTAPLATRSGFVGIREDSTRRSSMMRKRQHDTTSKCPIAERQGQGVAYDAASTFPEVSFPRGRAALLPVDAAASRTFRASNNWEPVAGPSLRPFQHAKACLPGSYQDSAQKL